MRVLSFAAVGAGPLLVLLHGTNTTRRLWAPVVPALSAERRVVLVDLPGHGASAPTSHTPSDYAREVAELLDHLDAERAAIAGLSIGGWVALELAKRGRASGALALVPAGLWAHRSPLVTDLGMRVNWRLARLGGRPGAAAMRSPRFRRVALRSLCAHPERVAARDAVAVAEDARASRHCPEHFRQTRGLRFTGGTATPPEVPVHVVWGDRDRVARARTSQHIDQLPSHARVETWPGCGHMLVWDAPERVVAAALAVPTTSKPPAPV